MTTISVTVNGKPTGPHKIPAGLSMNDFLREYLNLTGTKFGCGIGLCSACVIIHDRADGTSVTAHTCINAAQSFDGQSVRTIEGHAQNGVPTKLQSAFLDAFAFQCGYCTPGFVAAAQVLLETLARAPVARSGVEAAVASALDGHLCRCTGYVRYYAALRDLILADTRLTKA
ncbi:MAG: (2Fe-2S)-binding protein [Pseudorhodoplanes sp.]|uniref:(2Fe-2S)-binding protein n=1 Tax=Pseudorhodoplanes sp. TaxID=1934341 RepID=UPI003D0C82F6